MKKFFLYILALFATLFLAGPATAAIYKYVDESGVMHFTNTNPADARYKLFMKEKGDRPTLRKGSVVSGSYKDYKSIINNASLRHGVEAALITAVIKAESDFDPRAVSRAGARGLMQLMPKTADGLGVTNVYDPHENVNAGTRMLGRLLKKYNSDVTLALAAYNAGENKVEQYGTVPPYKETRAYVKRVLSFRSDFRRAEL